MALSFLYLAVRALLGALVRSRAACCERRRAAGAAPRVSRSCAGRSRGRSSGLWLPETRI